MKNILIVDDQPWARGQLKNELESHRKKSVEYSITEASNGQRALEIIESKVIDVIFLDFTMEGMSGVEFLKKVRSNPKYADIRVVMVTAINSDSNVLEALKAGVDAYIVKPILNFEVRQKLKKALIKVGIIIEEVSK